MSPSHSCQSSATVWSRFCEGVTVITGSLRSLSRALGTGVSESTGRWTPSLGRQARAVASHLSSSTRPSPASWPCGLTHWRSATGLERTAQSVSSMSTKRVWVIRGSPPQILITKRNLPQQTRTLRMPWQARPLSIRMWRWRRQAHPRARSRWGIWTTCSTQESQSQSSSWRRMSPARPPPTLWYTPSRPPGSPWIWLWNPHALPDPPYPIVLSKRLTSYPRPSALQHLQDQICTVCSEADRHLISEYQLKSSPPPSHPPPTQPSTNTPTPSKLQVCWSYTNTKLPKFTPVRALPLGDLSPSRPRTEIWTLLSCVLWRGPEEAEKPQKGPNYCSYGHTPEPNGSLSHLRGQTFESNTNYSCVLRSYENVVQTCHQNRCSHLPPTPVKQSERLVHRRTNIPTTMEPHDCSKMEPEMFLAQLFEALTLRWWWNQLTFPKASLLFWQVISYTASAKFKMICYL